jgi:hypothetical protein
VGRVQVERRESRTVDGDPALELLLRFDNDEPAFARGFEAGRLWQELRDQRPVELVAHVHAENLEMLLRVAEAAGYELRTEDVDETWVLATFTRTAEIES